MTKKLEKTIYYKEYIALIDRLKARRIELGLRQIDVAKHFDKEHSFISRIEDCQIRIDIFQLSIFCKLYKLPLTDIIKEFNL